MIRRMTTEDLDAVLKIESVSFAHGWGRDSLLYELNENPFANYFVDVIDDQVVGYVGLWITFESSSIINIACLPEYRHKGIGTELLKTIIDLAESEGCEFMTLEVRVSNTNAIEFYKKNGFDTVNIKKGYYSDNFEDAYYMVKALQVKL